MTFSLGFSENVGIMTVARLGLNVKVIGQSQWLWLRLEQVSVTWSLSDLSTGSTQFSLNLYLFTIAAWFCFIISSPAGQRGVTLDCRSAWTPHHRGMQLPRGYSMTHCAVATTVRRPHRPWISASRALLSQLPIATDTWSSSRDAHHLQHFASLRSRSSLTVGTLV